ncbi:PQQ-binding-like beta-propeller repeat protein [Actinotalea sp. M2MS4P-6]|uniref:outer membrane protein assembly factor BamB family protein n=1 Tax=Actinotalea sp. M2MS4P-6 TaxID=2983762 RepID=UPI0021E39B7F|nr:PQQ-binding-like beta-propeller repeat protein [Actinotalea sp. M2MS4P-6]MCV2393891.1 PQQ-binding-like beta-propeller repeat protein [Actinotalea sp. M2MS4P-6]
MGGTVDVELDDTAAPAPEPAGRRPRSRWVALAFVVVVVGTGLFWFLRGGQAAAQPVGLVTDLTQPRHELWRTEAASVIGIVGDVLVADRLDGTTVGLDLATGEQLWQVGSDHVCWVTDGSLPSQAFSVHPTAGLGADRSLVCQVGEEDGRALVTLDAADGSEVARLDAASSQTSVLVTVGDVLLDLDMGVTRTVTAVSTRGGELWSRTLDAPVYTQVLAGDRLVLPGPGGVVVLDLRTGEVSDDPGPWALRTVTLEDGGVLRTQVDDDGTIRTVVLDGDRQRWAIDGSYLAPALGVPVTGDVVLVQETSGVVVPVDVRTGEQAWSGDQLSFPLLGLDDTLVVGGLEPDGTSRLDVLDASTGATLWSVPGGAATSGSSPLCDGRSLGVAEQVNGEEELAVRDLRTGELVTSWPLPGAWPSAVVALDDGLIAQVPDVSAQPATSDAGVTPEVVILGP